MRWTYSLLLLAAAGCSVGDGSFRWYCDELSSQPNSWIVQANGTCGGLDSAFTLRFDETAAQPAGSGSTCTLSKWDYGSRATSDFPGTDEWCSASVTCALPDGSSATGNFQLFRWSDVGERLAEGTVDGAAGCSTSLEGRPQ